MKSYAWQCHLYTILAFNTHQNGIHVYWIISKNVVWKIIVTQFQAFHQWVLTSCPTWKPSSFLVDDSLAKIQGIKCVDLLIYLSFISLCIYLISHCLPKYCLFAFIHNDVFNCLIIIYIWHVCFCWLIKLNRYVRDNTIKIKISMFREHNALLIVSWGCHEKIARVLWKFLWENWFHYLFQRLVGVLEH